jgi:cytochrome c biogenesis protein
MEKEIPAARASRFDPLSLLWHAFAAPQTLMLCLGLIALAQVLASVVPQLPAQSLTDPQSWLALQSGPLASASNVVRFLVLYDVYHSFWFRLLLALTGLTLFVWLIDSADLAWRAARSEPWRASAFARWGSHGAEDHVLSFLPPQDTATRLRDLLREKGYRWASVPDVPVANSVAVSRGAALWSRPVALAGFLIALAGLATTGLWGWQGPVWQPAPGDLLPVGQNTPYQVRLESFGPASEADGSICDYRSEITWLKGDEPAAQNLVATGSPASFGAITMRQLGYVPAVFGTRMDVRWSFSRLVPGGVSLDGLTFSFRRRPPGP